MKEERDAFIRCVRTGEQPKPRVHHPLSPQEEMFIQLYRDKLGNMLYGEHPALSEIKKAEPMSGLAFYLPVTREDLP
jgi:hypothetical protein